MSDMSDFKIDRRGFLKVLGWTGAGTALAGCDLPTTVTLEEGEEEVVSYRLPKEYAIPGVAVWYASTCSQCPAACGIHGRVREGRVLKVEGNPDSPVNEGRTCMMGQAGLQNHYNPDRLTKPMQRQGGRLVPISWDDAFALIKSKVGPGGEIAGDKVAWFTGQVSGHQAVLIDEHLKRLGGRHYAYELVSEEVWRRVCADFLGDPDPVLDFARARLILSIGADFLGTGRSPVYHAKEYARFRRSKERGILIVAEPKMTLTGANADLWLTPKPGTEGVFALGVAHMLVKRKWNVVDVPAEVAAALEQYDPRTVSEITGVAAHRIQRVAFMLHERERSNLIVAGAGVGTHERGYQAAAAAMLLNVLMGNVGDTIRPGVAFPEPALATRVGTTRALLDFAQDIEAGKVQAAFIYGSNPVYTAPGYLKMKERLASVPFKVVLTQFKDETAMEADLVLPLHSYLEDWGTHVPPVSGDQAVLSIQQPLMEPLYTETRGFGDILLTLLKDLDQGTFGAFPDYYAYLRTAMENAPASVRGGIGGWEEMLQKGVLLAKGERGGALSPRMEVSAVRKEDEEPAQQRPFHLIPAPRMGMWDGRHANLPWIQEAPDPIAKVVWGSWAELHPKTARELGVKNGDYVRIESEHGAIETQVYVYNGIHPEAVAVPLGQGHEAYGRYAKGRGVNPLAILAPVTDEKTGELALYATRVSIRKLDRSEQLNKMGGSETQAGRKLVATISADVYRRVEGEV